MDDTAPQRPKRRRRKAAAMVDKPDVSPEVSPGADDCGDCKRQRADLEARLAEVTRELEAARRAIAALRRKG